jgi:hypothetical protein
MDHRHLAPAQPRRRPLPDVPHDPRLHPSDVEQLVLGFPIPADGEADEDLTPDDAGVEDTED